MSRQLLLIGGGHAHLGVLTAIARAPLPDTEVTLVSQFDRQVYSGMLPGWIAGHYALDDCMIPLPPLAESAGAIFVRDRVVALDLVEHVAYTEGGVPLPFDVVSIDIGPSIDKDAIRGLREHALPVRPIETLAQAWQRLDARFGGSPTSSILTVIGGGAAGVELALAISHRAQTRPLQLNVQLIAGHEGLLPTLPRGARRRIARQLPKHGVRVIDDDVVAVAADRVELARAGDLATDVTIAAIGAAASRWPSESGLQVDERGFIAVNSHLQSLSHPFAFAAGDCATIAGHARPKSGVYAVRAGPPLATNLRRHLTGQRLVRFTPQRTALYLLSTGSRYAVGAWGPFSFEGERVWRWKDRIDRAFVARHREIAPPRR